MLLLTQCAACAAPLGFSSGKKCGRCQTRYCGPACQEQHWKEGGHDQLCKKIKKAGGAEQYNANKKYAEAVAVAAEACAADTKGQTCYICTQALHWKTKEGLVRMCACRGTAGFAHVSCLAEQAKILVAEVEANNLGVKVLNERWGRWYTCGLCEQGHHGEVSCALGWGCWKSYLGRPEADQTRGMAMTLLANGLDNADHDVDALLVREADLATRLRIGDSASNILVAQGNLACTYKQLGRCDQALRVRRDVYSGRMKLNGEEHKLTCGAAGNYATSLTSVKRFKEAKSLLCRKLPVARRVLGEGDETTLRMRWNYGGALYKDDGATPNDLHESVATLEETTRVARRVLGGEHPLTKGIEGDLRNARGALRTSEGDLEPLREAVAAMMAQGGA